MKKLGMMFIMAGVLAFGLSSCGGEDDPATKPKPSFDWKGGADYVSTNTTVNAGTTIKFGINASGSENLEKVRVSVSYNGGSENILPISIDGDSNITDLKTKNFSMDIPYTVGSIPGTEKVSVTVTMSNSTSVTKSILITVNQAAQAVQSRSNAEMGAQSNATFGSFWSFTNFQALLTADANQDPGDIDMIYYYGATNKATFASPHDAQVTQVFNNVSSWSPRNASKFRKTTLSSADFDAITLSTELDTEVAAGGTLTSATNLAVGDVVLFITAGNKTYGLLRISAIPSAASNGSIQFDAKFISN